MITHIVLFKLKAGIERTSPSVVEAERLAEAVGGHVPELHTWRVGWNSVDRDIGYDYAAIGTLSDLSALEKFQTNEFHLGSVQKWRLISDWVVVDLNDV